MKRVFTIILTFFLVYAGVAQTANNQVGNLEKDPKSEGKGGTSITKFPLAGTWILKAAETILPDGTRITDTAYGKNAKGLLMIDATGQYSLQIFRSDRPKFSSGDKRKGTPEEYQSSLLGISTHIGHIKMDVEKKLLQFDIDFSAYPNWDHTSQTRNFRITGDELYYEVPSKTPGSQTAVSIWTRGIIN